MEFDKVKNVITWVQELEQKTTLVLSNTRELNRELCTETSILYTKLQWYDVILPESSSFFSVSHDL